MTSRIPPCISCIASNESEFPASKREMVLILQLEILYRQFIERKEYSEIFIYRKYRKEIYKSVERIKRKQFFSREKINKNSFSFVKSLIYNIRKKIYIIQRVKQLLPFCSRFATFVQLLDTVALDI